MSAKPYIDGTYSGSARNRIGLIAVSVAIKAGKITGVQVTACYTHYPEAYIDPVLPKFVVGHQSAQVPIVSGATLSTQDFQGAVLQALTKAKNPNYKA